jgi:hypothetical protein
MISLVGGLSIIIIIITGARAAGGPSLSSKAMQQKIGSQKRTEVFNC